LSIRIDELENKRQFKCTWVNSKLKEEVSIHPLECTGIRRLHFKVFSVIHV